MIKKILFSKDLKDYIDIDSSTEFLDNVKKINFFIGPNNSGKSRMMRKLFFGDFDALVSNEKTEKIQNLVNDLVSILRENKINGFNEKNDEKNRVDIEDFEVVLTGILVNYKVGSRIASEEFLAYLNKKMSSYTSFDSNEPINHYKMRPIITKWNKLLYEFSAEFSNVKSKLTTNDTNFIYIPILRGTRPFESSNGAELYARRIQKDYFEKLGDEKLDRIFSGYKIYNEVENLILGNIDKRDVIREYETFLEKNFFQKDITIIPQRGKDVLLIKIGNDDERLIYDLGDGIQAIILLTFPIFIRKDQVCTFFIEEPELHLHPSFKRMFLASISKNFPNHQYFLSTHSNHFLEAISEYDNVALYSFKKVSNQTQFHVQQLTSIKIDILDSLGVRNSSVLMSNCTIWVEGITDRLYIRKFLEVYFLNKSKDNSEEYIDFQEDHHYSFLEYAGSNIVHWNFNNNPLENINAYYISNNIFLIADSDYNQNGQIPKAKKERFKELKKSIGDNFFLIKGKEIENLLSIDTIKRVVADYENLNYDKIQVTQAKINFEKKNLGEWINNNVKPITRNYANANTISDKLNFCRKALKHIKTVDDLSKDAKLLCKSLYSFIETKNSDYVDF